MNAQIDALQAQNTALQQQISNLQTATSSLQRQINNITAAIADDGTAQALAGTWAGSANSVQFRRAVRSTSPGRRSTSNSFFPFPRRPGWATQRPGGGLHCSPAAEPPTHGGSSEPGDVACQGRCVSARHVHDHARWHETRGQRNCISARRSPCLL